MVRRSIPSSPMGWIVSLLVVAGVAFVFARLRHSLTTQQVQQMVYTAIQREAPASFLVTGTLDLSASVQPRLNTALALDKLLGPLLRSAGLRDVHFRFRIGNGVVSEAELSTLTTAR